MRRTLIIAGLAGAAALLVLWVGDLLEFEFPYTFALVRVRSAVSVSGKPFSEILKADGVTWASDYHWHTCSYCADVFGQHKNLILVRLSSPRETMSYYFAYCRPTHVLVPLTERTAEQFPALMPTGDELRPVGELDGTGRTSSFSEELKLPKNWYRTATGARPAGAVNGSRRTFR